MKNIEYLGYWWLPSNPDFKLAGTMKFLSEDGVYLDTLGSFTSNGRFDNSNSYDLILGIAKGGELITLYNCKSINTTRRSRGITQKRYIVTLALLGTHFTKVEALSFDKIVVEYNYLPDWVYSETPDFIADWHKQKSFNNSPTGELKAKVSGTSPLNQAEITIKAFNQSFSNFREFKQTRSAEIIIELKQQRLSIYEWYLNFLYPLQNFLSLATNRQNSITSISVYSQPESTLNHNREIPATLFSSIISQEQTEEKNLKQMLFTLKDIEPHFSLCIQKWLNINDDIKHICDVYFGIKYTNSLYGELRFLSIVQALESYHRIKLENSSDSQDKPNQQIEHKRRLEQIYERVPEQHLEWLKEQLAFSHEISFKNRIKDLCNKFQPIISPLSKNPNKFAAKVRDTRNYYTHYNQSLKSKAAKQNELFRLSQILNFLLQSCLLTELGFTSELCQSLISKDGEYKYLISELEKANFDW